MNRSRYIPFERNRYFYGKLLTVRDFMSEQTYFSDKRRLTNRLLFGSGVIAGLQVVAVDDKSISIETGAALDQMGREIIVPSPLTVKLSNVDGFMNNDYAKNVYLCLEYNEKGKEPVHTVAGASGGSEDVSEHNRILESYRLFVREQPPAPALQEYDYLIEDTSIWYDDGQVRVLQSVPRYIEPGQSFELKLSIEKTLQTPHISFEYELEMVQAESVEGEEKLIFSEPTDGGATSYTKAIRLRALPLAAGEAKQNASISAKAGTARLVIGDKLIYELSHIKQTVEVSEESAQERILDTFYSRSLDRAIETPVEPCLYLAKINLLQMGASYVIDSVESLPFNDYVINPTMLYKLISAAEKDDISHKETAAHSEVKEPALAPVSPFPDIKQEFISLLGPEAPLAPEQQVSAGITEISIVPQETKKWYQRRQKNFYSEEIEHGLGIGAAVFLTAGISDEQETSDIPVPEMWKRSNFIYSGAQDVFAGSEFTSNYPNISIGFIQDSKKGTFRIGIRVHQKTERIRIRIRWWAVKALEDNGSGQLALEELENGINSAATTTA
ncbi:hypothetical protein [Paenibacillus paridis]|uniref:hypothetical protein n=1 Tax=Paenibacillus paridis TaxID=2583376 RepID=UPI0011235265|nr:hypothetical protein [Paenibacillus paridis]